MRSISPNGKSVWPASGPVRSMARRRRFGPHGRFTKKNRAAGNEKRRAPCRVRSAHPRALIAFFLLLQSHHELEGFIAEARQDLVVVIGVDDHRFL